MENGLHASQYSVDDSLGSRKTFMASHSNRPSCAFNRAGVVHSAGAPRYLTRTAETRTTDQSPSPTARAGAVTIAATVGFVCPGIQRLVLNWQMPAFPDLLADYMLIS